MVEGTGRTDANTTAKVEQPGNSGTSTTKDTISQPVPNVKEEHSLSHGNSIYFISPSRLVLRHSEELCSEESPPTNGTVPQNRGILRSVQDDVYVLTVRHPYNSDM